MIVGASTLLRHVEAYPAPLEAVLRAEEALDTHFKACGALEGASVVGAVYAYALALFGSLVSHHG
jgi:hypothetical protein